MSQALEKVNLEVHVNDNLANGKTYSDFENLISTQASYSYMSRVLGKDRKTLAKWVTAYHKKQYNKKQEQNKNDSNLSRLASNP